MNKLKLQALDSEDLNVISAYCQDAVLRVNELKYFSQKKQFLLSMNRFVWENTSSKSNSKIELERRKSILHFNQVEKVETIGIDRRKPNHVLSLLAISLSDTFSCSKIVQLQFSDHAAIRLKIECIEAQLSDTTAVWAAKSLPKHPLD